MAFRGNKSGAMLGSIHIATPKRKKPDALPLFIGTTL
jgi:hypothetical protein